MHSRTARKQRSKEATAKKSDPGHVLPFTSCKDGTVSGHCKPLTTPFGEAGAEGGTLKRCAFQSGMERIYLVLVKLHHVGQTQNYTFVHDQVAREEG
jgi:hypothetical protein